MGNQDHAKQRYCRDDVRRQTRDLIGEALGDEADHTTEVSPPDTSTTDAAVAGTFVSMAAQWPGLYAKRTILCDCGHGPDDHDSQTRGCRRCDCESFDMDGQLEDQRRSGMFADGFRSIADVRPELRYVVCDCGHSAEWHDAASGHCVYCGDGCMVGVDHRPRRHITDEGQHYLELGA